MPKAKSNSKNKKQAKNKLALAAAGAGVAVLAAGAYFLQTAKNRKKLKGWMLKMKGEALERIEQLKEVNEEAYHKAVDEVAKRYISLKHIDRKELAIVTKELKSHWKRINRQISKIGK